MHPPKETIKALLIPTTGQAVGSMVVAIAIILVMQGGLILSTLLRKTAVPEDNLGIVVAEFLTNLSHLPFAERVAVGLFWAIVASLIYVGVVGLNNALISARNEFVIDTQFTNKGGRIAYLAKLLLLRASWLILLIGAVFFTLTIFFPQWMLMIEQSLSGDPSGQWLLSILAIIGLSFNVYIIWILVLAVISAPE